MTVSILARRTRRAQRVVPEPGCFGCPFQSSPAARDGRNLAGYQDGRKRRCFNPRPPHATGATYLVFCHSDCEQVSILARRTRRAQHVAVGANALLTEFQSSPAARDGRNRGWCRPPRHRACFNPRPPHATGATLHRPLNIDLAPVSILARRTRRAQPRRSASRSRRLWFQSSPAARDGRNSPPGSHRRARGCFNPRPPHATGATLVGAATEERFDVSILARRTRWAQPEPPSCGVSTKLLFQSSPAARDGRNRRRRARLPGHPCFNPRPPHATGATPRPYRLPYSRQCFNPRPPHATGATISASASDFGEQVSILARRTRRAQRSHSNFLIYRSESAIFREPPTTAPERADLTRHAVRNNLPVQRVTNRANLRANFLHCISAHHTTSGPSKSTDRKFPNCLIWRSAGSVRR